MEAQPHSIGVVHHVAAEPAAGLAAGSKGVYLETLSLIERLHRRFLDVVKAELDRLAVHDINNVQTLILYNIGGDNLTVGELTNRGYYLGSNVSYNVKKLVENDYLEQKRSPHDRRSVRVRVTEKGLALCQRVNALYDQHVEAFLAAAGEAHELAAVNRGLMDLERFWTEQLRFGP